MTYAKYKDDFSSVTDSFYDNAISGQSDTGKGTGKTTVEMKKLATFTDRATTGLSTSWDFNSIWNIRHNYIIQKMIKTSSRTILVNEPIVLLWLAVMCNTDRSNSAYAIYHGRFGKTFYLLLLFLY